MRRRILLVEDNSADVRLFEEAVREVALDAEVVAVADGEQALAHLRGFGARPDLVLLDLNLPRMSGREVLAAIKQDTRLRSIPIVVLSTSSSPRDIAECYDLHANCYLVKPLDLDEFAAMVGALGAFWLQLARLPEVNA